MLKAVAMVRRLVNKGWLRSAAPAENASTKLPRSAQPMYPSACQWEPCSAPDGAVDAHSRADRKESGLANLSLAVSLRAEGADNQSEPAGRPAR